MKIILRNYKIWLPAAFWGGVIGFAYLFLLNQQATLQGVGLILSFLYLWLIFGLLIYFLLPKVVIPRLKDFSNSWKITWFFASLFAGFWIALNIPLKASGTAFVNPRIYKLLFLASNGLTLGVLLFIISIFLATRKPRLIDQEQPGRWRWLIYALPMLTIWGIYLLAFWPGMMSADSIDQWGQVLSGQFTDHHPAIHTFIIWLLTRIYLSPVVIALAQILALGLLAGLVLAYFESMNVQPALLWIASFLFALSPVNGTMVNTLWKDIPYSTTVLFLSFLVLRMVHTHGDWLKDKWSWLLLGITAALMSLIRYNGGPIVLGTFVLLLLIFRRQWKPLLYSALLTAVLFLGVRGPLFNLVGVQKSTDLVEATTSLYRIAAQAVPGGQTDTVLNSMNPLASSWDCSIIMQLSQAVKNEPPAINASLGQEAANLVKHLPGLLVYDYRCQRSLVWVIWDPNGQVLNTSHVEVLDDPNPYGIVPDSKMPYLQTRIANFVETTAKDTGINWLVWRPALYLYLFLFNVSILALTMKDWRYLLIAVPILLQSIEATLITISPNFRYHYAAYLLALLFWPLLFARNQASAKGRPAQAAEEANASSAA